jgi:hypothetical protein
MAAIDIIASDINVMVFLIGWAADADIPIKKRYKFGLDFHTAEDRDRLLNIARQKIALVRQYNPNFLARWNVPG